MKIMYRGTVTEVMPKRVYGTRRIQEVEIRCRELDQDREKYPQELPFSVTFNPQTGIVDRTGMASSLSVGDIVSFSFSIQGRRVSYECRKQDKIFMTLRVCSAIRVIGRDGVVFADEVSRAISEEGVSDEYEDFNDKSDEDKSNEDDYDKEYEDDYMKAGKCDQLALAGSTCTVKKLNDCEVRVW